jgi:hypothetical protein
MNQEKLFTQLLYSRDHNRNKPWEGIGSAVFLHLDSAFYLVTAAHVLADNKGFSTLLNINGTSIDLAHYKVEKFTELDVAAVKLEETDYMLISEGTIFITEDMLRTETTDKKEIILMGYPRSRNKAKFRGTGFQPMLWRHFTVDCTEELELSNNNYKPFYFAAAYDPKKTEDSSGEKSRTPDKLPGISGGISLELYANAAEHLKLAPLGMIQAMSSKSKLIYGITFRYIFEWLRANSSHFLNERSARPQQTFYKNTEPLE